MNKVKKYIVSLSVMIAVSIVSIVIVSLFTYIFKWQADKAMIGIIISYILSGFSGGFTMKCFTNKAAKKEDTRKACIKEAFLLGSLLIVSLIAISIFVLNIDFEISGRGLLIWGILIGSTFLGRLI